jgi:hypothetical protein
MPEANGPEGKLTERDIAAKAMADRLAPWLALTVIGPVLIILVGSTQGVHSLERGDLYLYDLGVLLAGLVEVIANENVPHRAMQGGIIATVLLLPALGIFWSTAHTGSNGAVGSHWWCAVLVTVLTGATGLVEVRAGAVGAARTEVSRWAEMSS